MQCGMYVRTDWISSTVERSVERKPSEGMKEEDVDLALERVKGERIKTERRISRGRDGDAINAMNG